MNIVKCPAVKDLVTVLVVHKLLGQEVHEHQEVPEYQELQVHGILYPDTAKIFSCVVFKICMHSTSAVLR